MECTRRLAALSRAVECLALDFLQKSFGCSSVLLRMQSLALGLTNAVALHLRFAPLSSKAPPSPPLSPAPPMPMLRSPAPLRSALAHAHPPTSSCHRRRCLHLPHHLMQHHVCSTTSMHSPINRIPLPINRSKNSVLGSLLFLFHQPEAANPRVCLQVLLVPF